MKVYFTLTYRFKDYCQTALKSSLAVPMSNGDEGVFTMNRATALVVKGGSFSYESLTHLFTTNGKNFSGVALLFLHMEEVTKEDENVGSAYCMINIHTVYISPAYLPIPSLLDVGWEWSQQF